MKLVLASKSPRRREILGMVTKDFSVRVSDADESYGESTPLAEVPRLLAQRKAEATPIFENEVIIGCDTVVVYDGELMGKPKDKADAIRMLTRLSGTTHEVISGLCVRTNEKSCSCSVTTYVKFRELTRNEIENYVNTYNPVDKAGAYGIQESAGAFVEKIDGDFYNVVGLPLCKLCQILKDELGIELL
ncbi:MAG: septum formation protein Maf [Ruminococcaceae bacterium]|nr:septum formation protein Maf [Oscillospiraceae bacterium]